MASQTRRQPINAIGVLRQWIGFDAAIRSVAAAPENGGAAESTSHFELGNSFKSQPGSSSRKPLWISRNVQIYWVNHEKTAKIAAKTKNR